MLGPSVAGAQGAAEEQEPHNARMTTWLSRLPRGARIAVAVIVPLVLLAAVATVVLRGPAKSPRQSLLPTPSPSEVASPTPTDTASAEPSPEPTASAAPSPVAPPSPAAVATLHPTASTTVAPTQSTQPTQPPAPTPSDCTSAAVTNAITTDKSTYAAGKPVVITVTLTNHSATSCYYAAASDNPNICIDDGSHKEVWYRAYSCNGLPNTGGGTVTRSLLGPGQHATFQYSWNGTQTCYSCSGPAPAGAGYTVTGGWSEGARVTSAPFTLQ
jgi:hypothetical protein